VACFEDVHRMIRVFCLDFFRGLYCVGIFVYYGCDFKYHGSIRVWGYGNLVGDGVG